MADFEEVQRVKIVPEDELSPFSVSNKVILEYSKFDRSLQAENRSGLSFIKQKIDLVPFKVMARSYLPNNVVVQAGSTAYISGEVLHNAPWAKQPKESPAFPGKQVLIVDVGAIEFFDPRASK